MAMPIAAKATQHAIATPARSFLGEGLLLFYCLLTLGVLEPSLNVENFRDITLQQAVNDGAASLANQLKWLALAGLATFVAYRHSVRFWALFVAAWPLVLVLAYCLLSATWSNYPEISVRRSFGLIIPAYCVGASLMAIDRPERVIYIAFVAFCAALLCNLLVLPLAGSYDEFGFFRGICLNKNILGGIGALAILTGICVTPLVQGLRGRIGVLFYIAAWACLLVLSVSKTSIALSVGVPALFFGLKSLAANFRISVLRATGILVSVALTIIGACYWALDMSPSDLVHLFWYDATFTGRLQLWNFMLETTSRNWLFGLGFGSFWGVGSESPNLYAALDYIRLTNQAHDGYLDLVTVLGVVGLLLISLMIVYTLRVAEKLRFIQPAAFQFVWFIIIFSVIHNTMESSLLVPFSIVWHVTLLACLFAVWAAQQERS